MSRPLLGMKDGPWIECTSESRKGHIDWGNTQRKHECSYSGKIHMEKEKRCRGVVGEWG